MFKKVNYKKSKTKIEQLDKKQLEKVIGGTDGTTLTNITTDSADALKSSHEIAKNSIGNIR